MYFTYIYRASLVAQTVKNLPARAGDTRDSGLIPGSERSPGVGNGNPLQYSSLEKSHGQRRTLVGYSLWGHKKLDMTEATEHVCTVLFSPHDKLVC